MKERSSNMITKDGLLKTFVQDTGESVNKDQIWNEFVGDVDANGSGKISYDKFKQCLSNLMNNQGSLLEASIVWACGHFRNLKYTNESENKFKESDKPRVLKVIEKPYLSC